MPLSENQFRSGKKCLILINLPDNRVKKRKIKTIHIVTQGEYSDYRICGAFDSKENANYFIDKYGPSGDYDVMRIEKFTLNDFIDKMKNGLTYFYVRMHVNGDGAYTNTSKPEKWDKDRLDIKRNYFCAYCWAKDETHAIKIANERRVQSLATQNG